ncbi:SGNH/GDSL hydrolase family protein [Aquabacterium sp.]|uniref:SGNH/GDSL hydrolase family protein n=1 Tax=Aquabacterium sp. TaxID=1872578 RepID=UPI00378307F4
MSAALKLALAPVLVAQALHTRWRLPRLPEAEGAREGLAGGEARHAAPLRLLILGDSSAAGVGAATQDEALAGQLSQALARHSGRRVRWQLRARSGISSEQALGLLREAALEPADVAVVVTGVNDVVGQLRPARALAARAALLQALRAELGVRHTVLTPVPPMQRFAGLPQPLRWVAGRDARAHDLALQRWVAQQPGASWLPFDLPLAPQLLARDGFHPGPVAYRHWGEALAAHITRQVLAGLLPGPG